MEEKVDGRARRSERSRQAIVDAMIELVNEGNLAPTAQQVADRAGVAIRTVFRHFSEMEILFAEIDGQIEPYYRGLFAGGDRSGSLQQRMQHAVKQHALAFEKIAPMVRSTQNQLWRWPGVAKTYARNQRRLRKDLDDWLPELEDISDERREAIDAITSFEFWDRLRSHQGLDVAASTALIAGLLEELITGTDSAFG